MSDIFGTVDNPLAGGYGDVTGAGGSGGLVGLLSNILKAVAIIGGIWALINVVISGFEHITSGDDPKATSKAWSRIYNSLIGLAIIVASYAIAAILGLILFGDASAILSPTIYGPGS
ncbi:hypothetical protein ACFL1M_02580 [Patescibacteria group bacterium]